MVWELDRLPELCLADDTDLVIFMLSEIRDYEQGDLGSGRPLSFCYRFAV